MSDKQAALEALGKCEWIDDYDSDGHPCENTTGFDCDDAADFLTKHHKTIRIALQSKPIDVDALKMVEVQRVKIHGRWLNLMERDVARGTVDHLHANGYLNTELYKNSCDHCGDIVNKQCWTFNLEQCVVCENEECKKKQRAIFNKIMDDGVDAIIEQQMRKSNEQK